MTKELFRQDAYLRETTATVVAVGDQGVELDRTVFYPLGGGQAGDSGVLVLADGSTLVAVASQSRPAGGYLLQFGVIAQAGHVGYVTVQGQGASASAEYRRLLALFQHARWIEDDAQASGAPLLASR
jgi:misacylated tRNA(Ala) deacylase